MSNYRKFSGPLVPGTTSVRQFNRRNPNPNRKPFNSVKSFKPTYKSTDKKQSIAIVRLNKKFNQLFKADQGKFQKQLQYTKIGANDLTRENPVVIALNDFTIDSRPLQGKIIGSGAGAIPSFSGLTVFKNFVPQMGGFVNTDTGPNNYWINCNDDVASKKGYLALSTQMSLKFVIPNMPTTSTVRVRIDVIRQKRIMRSTANVHNLNLPTNTYMLGNLISDDPSKKNKINKDYFYIYSTKYITLNNKNDTATETIKRYCNLNFKFNKKHNCTKLDADHKISHGEGSEVQQDFYTNQDPDSIYWVLINTDCPENGQDGHQALECQIQRTINYRDPTGTAA